MSVPLPPAAFGVAGLSKVRAKPGPRWSAVKFPAKPLLVPLSMAGLLKSSAMVGVRPPLFCKPFESNFGLTLAKRPSRQYRCWRLGFRREN